MARIRTIKPEFPQSESMGRVSRDARLLFVELWTICDDHGRTRAHSRMLASLLFPYDDDAGELLPAWLDELEKERCIRLYEVNGSRYLQVINWPTHQKIDKPSKPQFPGPSDVAREDSRGTREHSSEEGIKDQGREGKGEESRGGEPTRAAHRGTRLPPDWKPSEADFQWARTTRPEINPDTEAERFADYWHGIAGARGVKLDWPATWRNWIRRTDAPRSSSAPRASGNGDAWGNGPSPAALRRLG